MTEQNAREAMEVWRQSKLAFDFAVSLPPYTVEVTPDQAAASVIAAKLAEKDAAHEATKAELQALREAAERCIQIVERHNHRQNEKVEDVKHILCQALTRKDA